MTAYYNENDPKAAAWLRALIEAGHIAHGEVDERSIEDAALKRQRVEDWQQAIHEMLGWMSTPDQFDPQDQPDDAILETAIDYAADQIEEEEGDIAPDSIVLSGSGRIAMEWNDGAATAIIEFVQRGKAHFTLFVEGKVREKQVLVRNPV
jgi:hypothetical protein